MQNTTLRDTLDTLRAEGVSLEAEAKRKRAELLAVDNRLANILGAIQNIEALLEDAAIIDDMELVDPDPETVTTLPERRNFEIVEAPARKRVPSTDWVAEVVNALGQPSTRDEIMAAFERQRGIPESWKANPRNSFNNALGRAVERGMIAKIGDDAFAPLNYHPFRERDQPLRTDE